MATLSMPPRRWQGMPSYEPSSAQPCKSLSLCYNLQPNNLYFSPLFTTPMYDRLGIHWGSSISAFLAAACLPFPLIFYKYGPAIRRHCRYAAESARQLDAMTDRMRVQAEQKIAGEKSSEQSAKSASSASAATNEEPNLSRKDDLP
jgi:hypothetical protein